MPTEAAPLGVVPLLDCVVWELRSSTDASALSPPGESLNSSGVGGGGDIVVTFWEAPLWSVLSLVVRQVSDVRVGWLWSRGGGCRGGGPRRWMFAEAAASGGVMSMALRGKAVVLDRMGAEPESRGRLARRPIIFISFLFSVRLRT